MGVRDINSVLAFGRRQRELYRDGMAAFSRGDFEAAIAAMTPLAGADTLHGRLARFYLSRSHRQLGLESLQRTDCQVAIGHLRTACRLNPAGGELARFLAVALSAAGRPADALGPLERALAGDRGDAQARVMLAVTQWRMGQPAAAELTLRQGLDLLAVPANPVEQSARAKIHLHLGLLACQSECWAQAELHLASSVADDENSAEAWRYLGLACGAQDHHEQAVTHLRRAYRLAGGDANIALELEWASRAAGQTTAHARGLRGQVENLFGQAAGQVPAGRMSAEQEAHLDRLARAIIAEPEFIGAFLDLPDSQMDQQIFSVLSLSLARAAAARPEYADLHYYIARVNRRLGRFGQAIASIERALSINPRYVAALVLAAGLYHQTAQRGASADRLRQAIAAGGDYPDVHLLLGHQYRELGQVDRARRSYQRALKLKPDYAPAAEALAGLAA